jgi:hypothetical protein
MEAKETYYGGKRDLLWRQKRPTKVGREECGVGRQGNGVDRGTVCLRAQT